MAQRPFQLSITALKPLAAHFPAWREAFGTSVFIETGTHMGGTARSAADHFEEVHTIELSRPLYERAKAHYAEVPGLHFHHGDSAERLGPILDGLGGRRAILWLDAHFSGYSQAGGVMTARGSTNCPTLAELEALRVRGIQDAVILVDDLRQFMDPSSADPRDAIHTGYPELKTLVHAIQSLGNYRIYTIGDILFAHPASDAVQPSQGLAAMTKSRIYAGDILEFEATVEAERALLDLPTSERAVIATLVEQFARSSVSRAIHFGAHYLHWEGLAQLGSGHPDAALRCFEAARASGLRDGRAEVWSTQARTLAAMGMSSLV